MPRRAADLLVDCLAAHGVDRVFCVPGESYLAALDALHDSNAIETVDLPARGRRGLHGGRRRQADGPAGRRVRQPRPGRHQRLDRRARGRAGCGAAGAVHRPGAARRDRPALVPGGGLRQDVRRHGQGRLRDPGSRRASPRSSRAPSSRRRRRRRGRSWSCCPRTCWRTTSRRRVVEPLAVPRAGPASADELDAILARLAKAERPLLIAGGGGLGTARGRAGAAGGIGGAPAAGGADLQAAGLLPQHAPALCRAPRLQDAEADRRPLPRRRPDPRRRHAAGRGDDAGLHAAASPRAAPAADPRARRSRARSAATTRRRMPLIADPIAVPGGAGRAARQGAGQARAVGEDAATSRSPRAWPGRRRPTGCSTWAPVVAALAETAEQGRDLRHRRRQLLGLAAPAFPVLGRAPADRLRRRRHGHRHAGGGGGGAAPSRAGR